MTDVPNECMKDLTAKLQAALLNIKAKEDLVRQHAKVAEEAVTGNCLIIPFPLYIWPCDSVEKKNISL